MLILNYKEVNLEEILKRFVNIKRGFLELEIGHPLIGRKWEFEDEKKIFPQDLITIINYAQKEYSNEDYDLIILDKPIFLSRMERIVRVKPEFYKKILF